MPAKSIQDQLKHSFPKPNKEIWSNAASPEVQGKNPFDVLSWKTNDGLIFFPYYDRWDSEKNAYLKHFEFPPSENPFAASREWVSMPMILVLDEMQSNKKSLHALATGADGILFDLRKSATIDIDLLLDKINLPYCSVSFFVSSESSIVRQLQKYILDHQLDATLLTGSIFCEGEVSDPVTWLDGLSSFKKIHGLGICISPDSPVTEVSNALTKATLFMDRLTNQGVEKETAWHNISISLTLGTDFFLDIAKLKALRLLWYQLARGFDISNYQPSMLDIHAVSTPWIKEAFQPHGNMLKGTSASLAAILGGCNALTVLADDDNIMQNRIANNISNLLREESYLDKVSDASAGAYALDAVTHQLAEASWNEFKRKIKTL